MQPTVTVLAIRAFDDDRAALKALADVKVHTQELGDWIVRNVRLKQDRDGNYFVREPKLGFKDPIIKQLIFITPVSIPGYIMGFISDAVKSEYFKLKGGEHGTETK